MVDIVDAHDRLRAALAAASTENERAALGQVMRGEPIARQEGAPGRALALAAEGRRSIPARGGELLAG